MREPSFPQAALAEGPAAIVCWSARWYEGDQARESSVEPARRWRYACS